MHQDDIIPTLMRTEPFMPLTSRKTAVWQRLKHLLTRDSLMALLYASPALIIFALFTYVPFIRAIYLRSRLIMEFVMSKQG